MMGLAEAARRHWFSQLLIDGSQTWLVMHSLGLMPALAAVGMVYCPRPMGGLTDKCMSYYILIRFGSPFMTASRNIGLHMGGVLFPFACRSGSTLGRLGGEMDARALLQPGRYLQAPVLAI